MYKLFIPTDRVGLENYQRSIGETYTLINEFLGEGLPVEWYTTPQRLVTARWKEGHIFESGFAVPESVKGRLEEADVIYEEAEALPGEPRYLKPMKVAFYLGRGEFSEFGEPLEEVLGWGGFHTDRLTDEDIRAGKLENYDVLVTPGTPDAGECYYHGFGELGMENIRRFIRERGHYLGVCGGAYLPLTAYNDKNHTWLNIVEATDTEDLDFWRTGSAHVRCRIEEAEHPIFTGVAAGAWNSINFVYWEGPAIEIRGENIRPLATFEKLLASGAAFAPYWDMFDNTMAREAVHEYYNPVTPEEFDTVLKGRTAVAEAEYGDHHLLLFSPHPEAGNVGYAKRRDSLNFLLLYNGLFYLSSL